MTHTALLAALLLLAGCTATPAANPPDDGPATPTAPSATPHPTVDAAAEPTAAATTGPTATLNLTELPAYTAENRAIRAEKERIRGELSDRENLTGLSFGILRPAEASVVDRNATGSIVAVTVGYSFSFDDRCSFDGAATRTRYLITENRTRLLAVEQGVTDAQGC